MTPILTATWTLVAGALVLFLPGIAWQSLFWNADQDLFERIAEAIGLSISLTALTALFFYLVGWKIPSAALILGYLLLVPFAGWGLWRYYKAFGLRRVTPTSVETGDQQAGTSTAGRRFKRYLLDGRFQIIGIALIFIFVLVWRFYQIRELVLPLWVDSVHHVQIVKLLLDNGGIPDTFEPYMPVPFFYHYAFHLLAAIFSFMGAVSPEHAVLYLGQVLNAGIALAVYRLGKALWGDWRRAVIGAVVVAFVTQMPAYYVTWGRYTLLAGMVLLPLAMAAALDIQSKGARLSSFATLVLLVAGILLTHYFAAFLLSIFLVLLFAQAFIQGFIQKKPSDRRTWMALLSASIMGLILAGPWLYRLWGFIHGSVRLGAIQPSMQAMEEVYFPDYLNYLWRLLGPEPRQYLIFLALPGLVITLLHKRTFIFGLWTIFLGLIAQPFGFKISPFRPDHAVIVLFLPIALLIAELFISMIDWAPKFRFIRYKTIPLLIAFTALVGWGIWTTRTVINPATILGTKADLEAVSWIGDNISDQARFLINVTHWQYGSYRGVDGGWWITPLTGRETILPNALYGMGQSEYKNQVNALAARVSQVIGCSDEFWELVQSEGLTHVYIRQGRGSMQPDQFKNCQNLELVFDKDDVYIYLIRDIILKSY